MLDHSSPPTAGRPCPQQTVNLGLKASSPIPQSTELTRVGGVEEGWRGKGGREGRLGGLEGGGGKELARHQQLEWSPIHQVPAQLSIALRSKDKAKLYQVSYICQ